MKTEIRKQSKHTLILISYPNFNIISISKIHSLNSDSDPIFLLGKKKNPYLYNQLIIQCSFLTIWLCCTIKGLNIASKERDKTCISLPGEEIYIDFFPHLSFLSFLNVCLLYFLYYLLSLLFFVHFHGSSCEAHREIRKQC